MVEMKTITYNGVTYEIVDEKARTKVDELNEEIVNLNIINVKDYGAKGDGINDDSNAIKLAIADLPNDGGILYFPIGTYLHGDGVETGLSYPIKEGTTNTPNITNNESSLGIGKDIRFNFDGYSNLIISGYGATIVSNDNNGECRNNAMFIFKNCHSVSILGLSLDGRRQERGIKLLDYGVGDANQRGNIYFGGGCTNILIRDVVSNNSAMDGIMFSYNGGQCSNVLVENCIFNNAHRNGIVFGGTKNATVRFTECSYTGTGSGILPKCGIDVEAHVDNVSNENIVIDNCRFVGNDKTNISVANNSYNTIIQNSFFEGATIVESTTDGSVVVDGNKLYNCYISTSITRIVNNMMRFDKQSPYEYWMARDSQTNDRTTIIENNVFDFTPKDNTLNDTDVIGVNLGVDIYFKNNIFKNSVSRTSATRESSILNCEQMIGNTFILEDNVVTNKSSYNVKDYLSATNTNRIWHNNSIIGYSYIGNEGYCKEDYLKEANLNKYATIEYVDSKISSAPLFTNKADIESADWLYDVGIMGSTMSADEIYDGAIVTNYIYVEPNDTVYIENFDIISNDKFNMQICNSAKVNYSSAWYTSQLRAGLLSNSNMSNNGGSFVYCHSAIGYLRFTGYPTKTANDIIISVNEPIIYDGYQTYSDVQSLIDIALSEIGIAEEGAY